MPLAWQRALPVDWTLKGRWDRNVISRSPGHHRQVAQRRSVIETMCFAVLKNGGEFSAGLREAAKFGLDTGGGAIAQLVDGVGTHAVGPGHFLDRLAPLGAHEDGLCLVGPPPHSP